MRTKELMLIWITKRYKAGEEAFIVFVRKCVAIRNLNCSVVGGREASCTAIKFCYSASKYVYSRIGTR